MRSLDMKHLYIAIAASAAVWAAACDRGCVSKATLGDSPVASALSVKQDCPTGLARCTEGAVEITEGRVACPSCPCAWKRVKVCTRGCIAEDVTFVRDARFAETLCRATTTGRFSTNPPPDAGTDEPCPNEGERFLCRRGMVFACPSASAVPVALCTHGCADEGETVADPSIDIAAATALMCSHDPSALDP